jgi:gamma-glutamyl hydrolase
VLTQYGLTGQRIFNESVNSFAKGEIWPLWGTCLGFELINVLAAEDDGAVLTPGWDSENYTTVVSWVDEAATSRLWSSPSVRAAFATENIALNAHTSGVSPADFASATALSSRFSILGTSVDRNQKEFVASIEGKDNLPIYATQWHPEKALFEWPEDWVEYIPHNYSAVSNNYAPAAFFVEQARKNLRAFPSPAALDEVIIYNYNPIHGISTNFEQIYFFPQSN